MTQTTRCLGPSTFVGACIGTFIQKKQNHHPRVASEWVMVVCRVGCRGGCSSIVTSAVLI